MIDKFCFITDSHFRNKTPDSRTDNYLESLLAKLDWVIDFCNKKKIKRLLHGGDMFDNPFVSDYVAGIVARKFTESGLDVYAILGNHDITGKNASSYVYGKMHLFEQYPWFHLIGEKYIEFSNCYITGFNYSMDTECPVIIDVKMDLDKPVICMTHSMICGGKGIPEFGVVSLQEVMSNAAVNLTGHYHIGYPVQTYNLSGMWSNPGAFGRTSITDNRKGIGPGLTYVKVKKDSEPCVKRYAIPCDKKVFKSVKIVEGVNKARFEKALMEIMEKDTFENNVFSTIAKIEKQRPKELNKIVSKRVITMCKLKLKEISDGKVGE